MLNVSDYLSELNKQHEGAKKSEKMTDPVKDPSPENIQLLEPKGHSVGQQPLHLLQPEDRAPGPDKLLKPEKIDQSKQSDTILDSEKLESVLPGPEVLDKDKLSDELLVPGEHGLGGEPDEFISPGGHGDNDLDNDDNSLDISFDSKGSENEFRMPENFDIPHDYIQEIVPKKSITLKPEERLANLGVPPNPLQLKPSAAHVDWKTTEDLPTTTYYSKESSSKSTKSTKRHNSGDLKRNRKRQSYADLFGECSQESEDCVPEDTPKSRKEFETCGGTSTILTEKPEPKQQGRVPPPAIYGKGRKGCSDVHKGFIYCDITSHVRFFTDLYEHDEMKFIIWSRYMVSLFLTLCETEIT